MTLTDCFTRPRTNWGELAACKGEDPALWDGSEPVNNHGRRKYNPLGVAICREHCPVRAECLASAMADSDDDCSTVIRGGFTPVERNRIRAEQAGSQFGKAGNQLRTSKRPPRETCMTEPTDPESS